MQVAWKLHAIHAGGNRRRLRNSAGELIARKFQPIEVAKRSNRNRLGLKKLIRQAGEILGGDRFDSLDQFVQIVIAIKIHLLSRQVRHARGA